MEKYSVQLFNGEELAQCNTLDEAINEALKQYRLDRRELDSDGIDPMIANEDYYFIDNNETLICEATVTRSGEVMR